MFANIELASMSMGVVASVGAKYLTGFKNIDANTSKGLVSVRFVEINILIKNGKNYKFVKVIILIAAWKLNFL